MNNRSKRKVAGSHASLAHKSSAPSYIAGTITIEDRSETFRVQLPCTLADMAAEVAESVFAICEVLAFKSGVKFLPAKEILTDGQAAEKIPFQQAPTVEMQIWNADSRCSNARKGKRKVS